MKIPLDKARAVEAKAIAVQAFRNGPIEVLHAGKVEQVQVKGQHLRCPRGR